MSTVYKDLHTADGKLFDGAPKPCFGRQFSPSDGACLGTSTSSGNEITGPCPHRSACQATMSARVQAGIVDHACNDLPEGYIIPEAYRPAMPMIVPNSPAKLEAWADYLPPAPSTTTITTSEMESVAQQIAAAQKELGNHAVEFYLTQGGLAYRVYVGCIPHEFNTWAEQQGMEIRSLRRSVALYRCDMEHNGEIRKRIAQSSHEIGIYKLQLLLENRGGFDLLSLMDLQVEDNTGALVPLLSLTTRQLEVKLKEIASIEEHKAAADTVAKNLAEEMAAGREKMLADADRKRRESDERVQREPVDGAEKKPGKKIKPPFSPTALLIEAGVWLRKWELARKNFDDVVGFTQKECEVIAAMGVRLAKMVEDVNAMLNRSKE